MAEDQVVTIRKQWEARCGALQAELEDAYNTIEQLVESDAPVVTVRIEVVKAEDV